MDGPSLAPGTDLLGLLERWYEISSASQPGQANDLRFPFLKWALKGRAQDVLNVLRQAHDPRMDAIADEIERIAGLPFPPRNEKAQQMALDMWAWLKVELYGSTDGP